MISCHRGFHCDPGAEGVGRAATNAFVYSFVVILMLDLFLGIFLDAIYDMLWPQGMRLLWHGFQSVPDSSYGLNSVQPRDFGVADSQTDVESRSAAANAVALGVRFGRQPVLRNINLTIPRGQTLAIIGESGCGKTVLLKTPDRPGAAH